MVEVKNQGRINLNCRKAEFFVTSQGECLRHNKLLSCSSLNLCHVCEKYGFDWEKVSPLRHNDRSALGRRWREAQEKEWEELYSTELTKREYKFLKLVLSFQKVVDFGRFRVYGEIRHGHPQIIVVTEFQQVVENDKFWTDFNKMVTELDAGVCIMSEEANRDHSYKTSGPPDYVKIEGSDKYGPHYGKVERQVECSWRIEKSSPDELKELVRLVRRKTQKLWKQSGVGVL